ncbi:chaoptin-like protein [Dinothrombium tinctorium]|uniref:Chaoptin-like protein n=1 Tax=Dinothrombium tinctorium TaxID=1965070 RepID=A0A443RBP8_9ACAR|nr:chaoptin-like protein [Dinothrombium tinctorium]
MLHKCKSAYRSYLRRNKCRAVADAFIVIARTLIAFATSNAVFPYAVPATAVNQYLEFNSQFENAVFSCRDLFRSRFHKQLPCICSRNNDNTTAINCDRVAFFGQFPVLPFRSSITSYTQRFAGIQNLESQLFTASDVRLRRVDFSHNLLRRLMERLFDGIEQTLIELNLGYNLLGDQLNPIFSTNEFLQLHALRVLDLSFNQIRALDSNIFKGLKNLTYLTLEGNELKETPMSSLSSLTALQELNLGSNYINELSTAFPSALKNLKRLNLTNNQVHVVKSGVFAPLSSLETLQLAYNKLRELSALAMDGLFNLKTLDLSHNFFETIPIESVADLSNLTTLLMGSNNIQVLEEHTFNSANLLHLEHLDLSRNRLATFTGEPFIGLNGLRQLNLAFNALSKLDELDEKTFAPLTKLEILDLTDNQLIMFPSNALYALKNLRKLFLDYNKISIVNENLFSSINQIEELSLAYNLIQELPDRLFFGMRNLRLLNLHANKLEYISQEMFEGCDQNLLGFDLGFNDIVDLPQLRLPRLLILNLAMNQIAKIGSKNAFESMPSLRHFNLSYNQIAQLNFGVFDANEALEVIDLKANLIERIDKGVFTNASFITINLSQNKIKEISHGAFVNLPQLMKLDLSKNEITSIKTGAFERLPSLKMLNLNGNRLTSFKGDFFASKTVITAIDLCNNQISYLYPNSFLIHRKLRTVLLSHNKLSYFPSEILNSIRTLEKIDLSYNKLQSLDNADFANIPRLRILNLEGNDINIIADNVFHNSSLLQHLDLSDNRIETLSERTFKGIARLNLDLSRNKLNRPLPEEIFSRQNLFTLESIDLSANNITDFPQALKKQYSCLERINLSYNKIESLPPNSDVLVNVKDLDLSHNPLSVDSHHILFSEPKSVRKLSVASTRINALPAVIETPFLKVLNLSLNNVTKIESSTFHRSTLLQVLDLSSNKLPNLNLNVKHLWEQLEYLRELYLSHNPIQFVMKRDFESLSSVQVLDLSYLPALTHFECDSLSPLNSLKVLKLFGYRSLNYLEVQECLSHISSKLEKLAIEVKEQYLQGHLQNVFSNRINEVMITGNRLTTLSSNSLYGIKSKEIKLKLMDTSVNTIPASIFSSLPLSTKVEIDLQSNEITNLNYQLLNTLATKQMNVKLRGLQTNPIKCDCNLEPLWKYSREKMNFKFNVKLYNIIDGLSNLTCFNPSHLYGHKIIDLRLEELTCSDALPKQTTSSTTLASSSTRRTTIFNQHLKPDIIFELPTTRKPLNRGLSRSSDRRMSLTKVDTMIIGIVAGVIAFVCILVLIICVVRVRSNASSHSAAAVAASTLAFQHSVGCTCVKPMQNSCTACYPAIATAYSGTIRATRPPTLSYYNGTLRPLPIKMIAPNGRRR